MFLITSVIASSNAVILFITVSFFNLGNGEFLNRITWNKDCDFLLSAEQHSQKSFSQGDVFAGYHTVSLWFVRNTDLKIVFHILHLRFREHCCPLSVSHGRVLKRTLFEKFYFYYLFVSKKSPSRNKTSLMGIWLC